MRVISHKKIAEFGQRYPDSINPLNAWYKIVSNTNYDSSNDLRKTFPNADSVGKLTVFNIGGNKYRLIAAIHYKRKMKIKKSEI